jgi:hypothetical protein
MFPVPIRSYLASTSKAPLELAKRIHLQTHLPAKDVPRLVSASISLATLERLRKDSLPRKNPCSGDNNAEVRRYEAKLASTSPPPEARLEISFPCVDHNQKRFGGISNTLVFNLAHARGRNSEFSVASRPPSAHPLNRTGRSSDEDGRTCME